MSNSCRDPYRCALAGLLLVWSCLVATPLARAQETELQRPRITALRMGLAGGYKLGCWTPVEITLSGGAEAQTGRVVVTVPDTDGVPTTFSTLPNRPVAVEPGGETTASLSVRVGQSNASVHVAFRSPENRKWAERTFFTGAYSDDGILGGLPATNRLYLEIGPRLGLSDLLTGEVDDDLTRTQLVALDSVASLPTDWLGYEGFETVFLTTSKVELYRPLAQSTARLDALESWVRMGGKLVIFCGANAEELLGPNGVLTRFAPGRLQELVSLQSVKVLQTFSQVDREVSNDRRLSFAVPLLAEVHGRVLASAQHGAQEIPIVVQSSLGFGEVKFVTFDFDRPPLRDWEGRTSFLRRVLYNTTSVTAQQEKIAATQQSNTDLVNQVRTVLDNSFVNVATVPFGVVALLVFLYILLIGPGDYYLVHKVLKRPELTWLSFPLAVLGVSAAAYWYANWTKGDKLRVNQVEFVDLDAETQLTRGTTWTHFFSPQVAEFDLRYQPVDLAGDAFVESQQADSWLGQPGYSLGGMQTSGSNASWFDSGYILSATHDAIEGLPVQLWSTKTITSRWQGKQPVPLRPDLVRAGDQLITGTIMNASPTTWQNCALLYGQWAWDVGQVGPRATINLEDLKQPRLVRTLLTNATAGDKTIMQTADDGTVPFHLGMNDLTRLAKTLMFYEAINGARYTSMLDRYQAFLDMSHFLDLPNRAVLLAQRESGHGRWLSGEEPLASDQDRHWTYFRFVLPVEED